MLWNGSSPSVRFVSSLPNQRGRAKVVRSGQLAANLVHQATNCGSNQLPGEAGWLDRTIQVRHYLHAQRRFQRQPRRSHMLSPRPRTMKHTSLIRANDDTAPLPTGRVFDGDRRDGLPSLGSVDLESVSSKSRSASAEALQSASQSASGASASLEELKLSYVGWWLVVGHGGPSLGAENSSL